MKFCMPHWNTLRQEVIKQGLGSLVSKDGHSVVNNMKSEMDHGLTIDNFDPLMGAHNAILANFMGLDPSILTIEGCPLCYGNERHLEFCTEPNCSITNFYDNWIKKAVNDQVKVWKELKT